MFCYERDFMMSLFDVKQADIIVVFYTTSRYLYDILNIKNIPLIKQIPLILKVRKTSRAQQSIESSTSPVPGHQMGK